MERVRKAWRRFQLTERMLLGRARGEWNSRMITPSTELTPLSTDDPLIGDGPMQSGRDAARSRATASPQSQIAGRAVLVSTKHSSPNAQPKDARWSRTESGWLAAGLAGAGGSVGERDLEIGVG